MPYGVKRGVKAPGEYGIGDITGLAFAGAAGIVAALVTDYQQKGEASALYTLNHWAVELASLVGFGHVPLWTVVVSMIAIGAGSIFYFQPITRQGAFAQGFGLLAVIMTATPSDLAGALVQANGNLAPLQPIEASYSGKPQIIPASYSSPTYSNPAQATLTAVQASRAARYTVELRVTFPDGISNDIDTLIRRGRLRGRLHNEQSGETFNLFLNAGNDVKVVDKTLIIRAGVPARAENATLWVRIECDQYSIEEQSAVATLGEPLIWPVTMVKSSTPLFLQRLGKSYWF